MYPYPVQYAAPQYRVAPKIHDETKTPYPDRGNWGSKLEFFLACVGHNIGVYFMTAIPIFLYTGGGVAFVIPLLIFYCLVAIPLFFLQISMGQFCGSGIISAFNMSKLFKGFGFALCIFHVVSSVLNVLVAVYSMEYLRFAISYGPPWPADCSNSYNTDSCSTLRNDDQFEYYRSDFKVSSTSEFLWREFLKENVLLGKLLVVSSVLWICLFLLNIKGIKILGKLFYVTTIFPFGLLLIIFIRVIIIPGAISGIVTFWAPRFEGLWKFETWIFGIYAAIRMSAECWGVTHHLASYNKFSNNTKDDAFMIPIVSLFLVIILSFIPLMIYQHYMNLTHTGMQTLQFGLVFMYDTLPEVFAVLQPSRIWMIFFYLGIFLFSMHNAIIKIHVVLTSLLDEFEKLRGRRLLVLLAICLLGFVMILPFCTHDGYALWIYFDKGLQIQTFSVIMFWQLLIVNWFYGQQKWRRDLEFMLNRKVEVAWFLIWKFIVPIALVIAIIKESIETTQMSLIFPKWMAYFSWLCTRHPYSLTLIYAVYMFLNEIGSLKTRFGKIIVAMNWVPAAPRDRERYLQHCGLQGDGQQLLTVTTVQA